METLPVLTTWIFEKGAAVLFMDENRGAKKTPSNSTILQDAESETSTTSR